MNKVFINGKYVALTNSILIASAAALGLYLLRFAFTGDVMFGFMAWNLVLSLLALLAAVTCVMSAGAKQNKQAIVAGIIWLFLLPNTFYMLTDFIHVKDAGDITVMFDIVMVGLFAMNGFLHGLLSLYLMHRLILKKVSPGRAMIGLGVVILLASFAVDMGRYLRWNSWDVLLHPADLLVDVSDTLLHPLTYDRSYLITGVFFVTITSLYAVVWQLSKIKWGKHERTN